MHLGRTITTTAKVTLTGIGVNDTLIGIG